jgi:hypothetical protein
VIRDVESKGPICGLTDADARGDPDGRLESGVPVQEKQRGNAEADPIVYSGDSECDA